MKNILPVYIRAGRSAKRLRRYAVPALCAALLTLIVVSSYAQRRTVIRVPRGESAASAEARREAAERGPLSEADKRREEAGRRARARLMAQARGGVAGGVRQADGYTKGVPTEGARGVERTTGDIMTSQSYQPDVERAPRLVPEHETPDRSRRPQDPNAKPAASTNPAATLVTRGTVSKPGADAAAPLAPQTVGTNFTGATLDDTGAFPPDSMGTVGPTQFFVFVNGRLRTFDKTTGAADGVINADPDVFFSSVMTPVVSPVLLNFTSDPNVRYDRLTGRWFLTIIDVPCTNATCTTTAPNRILIAVSDAASNGTISGSTVWTLFFVQQDTVGAIPSTNEFLDYPSLGIDANALYIGGNMFEATLGDFLNTSAFVIRKSSVTGGGPVVATAFRNLISDINTGDGAYSPRGVDNYDPAAAEGYFIGISWGAFGRVNMRRVATPGATPSISADIPINTPLTTSFPIPVAHLGNTGGNNGRIDSLDDRLYAAHIRNGRLWTSHNIGVTNTGAAGGTTTATGTKRDAVRWYELNVPVNTGTPTVVQSATIFDSAANVTTARQFSIPSVMVSGQGHAALGYTTAGTTFPIDAATSGRLRTDTLGTTQAFTAYTNATGNTYNPPSDPGGVAGRRWGDYSFTSLDPRDDMTMWTIQEFCSSTNKYGVRIAKLAAPPPASPSSSSLLSIPPGLPSVSITVTGSSVNGSEFYDPGANLAPPALPFNHISATLSGGVTVNSVTYLDPTHVTLDLNTVAATLGGKNITVTNPDGQSATSNGVVFVGAAPASPILISEFRFQGAAGGNDEYIELYNNTGANITVADTNGGTGYAVVGTNTTGTFSNRCTVPNGTVIPARGHFLCVNNGAAGYSLGGYAAGDVTYATGIVAGGGVAVFSTTTAAAWATNTRFDAVGFLGITGTTLFTEGSALAPSGGISVSGEHAFVRKMGTATNGLPQDTNDNQSDFAFVSTDGGTYSTRVSTLGAPGPENLASPIQRNTSFGFAVLDTTVSASNPPNRDRDFTAAPPNAPLGTLTIRRAVTNNTGATVTRLRFRIIDVTTFNSPTLVAAPQAQLRAVNSGSSVVTVNGTPTTVEGTSIETPPAQPNGGGLNTSLGRSLVSGTIINTPIAPGATVNLQFVLGVVQSGNYRFYVNVEALP
jgi:hypothetical protein